MKTTKKVLALILSVVMFATTFMVAASAIDKKDVVPSIIVPGLFQSETKYYEDGKATDLAAPFFIGTLILGFGMSLVMTDLAVSFGGFIKAYSMFIGIFCGVIGIVFAGLAHPLYNRILKKEKEKIAPEIIRLTDELMK